MGLIYDSGESRALINTLSANLSSATAALTATESACDRLGDALGGGELSGQGYAAVGALFAEVVLPGIADARREVEAIRGDLDSYTQADGLVSRYGVLHEDRLRAQLESMRVQRDATEETIETNRRTAAAATALPGVGAALEVANAQLEMVLAQLERDIRELEDKLRALREFEAAVSGLFRDGLDALSRVSEPIAFLGKAISVSADLTVRVDTAILQAMLDGGDTVKRAGAWVWGVLVDEAKIAEDDPEALLAWATGHGFTVGEGGAEAASRFVYGQFRLSNPAIRTRGKHSNKPANVFRRWWESMKTGKNWTAKPGGETGFSKLSAASKWVGRAGSVFSGAVAGVEQWNEDEHFETDERVGRAVAKGAGTALGAAGGAWAGAQVGTAIGALGGPVGAVVGGLVGAAVGGLVGSGIGEKLGDWGKDMVSDPAGTWGKTWKAITFWD